MAAPNFNTSTWEAKVGRFLNLKPVRSIQQTQGCKVRPCLKTKAKPLNVHNLFSSMLYGLKFNMITICCSDILGPDYSLLTECLSSLVLKVGRGHLSYNFFLHLSIHDQNPKLCRSCFKPLPLQVLPYPLSWSLRQGLAGKVRITLNSGLTCFIILSMCEPPGSSLKKIFF